MKQEKYFWGGNTALYGKHHKKAYTMASNTRFKYQIGKTLIEGNSNDKSQKRLAWFNTVMYWIVRLIMAASCLQLSYKLYEVQKETKEKTLKKQKPIPEKTIHFPQLRP